MVIQWICLGLAFLFQLRLAVADCSTAPDVIPYSSNDYSAASSPYARGARVEYRCDFGYIQLEGYRQSTCSGTSWVWQHDRPLVCSPGRCPRPPAIANGQRTSGLSFGDAIVYTCNTGYELRGERELVCQANREWDAPYPTCHIVQCSQLYNPRNGDMNSLGRDYGHVAMYTCNRCYGIRGSATRECQADGTWSGENAECIEISCGIPSIPYGHISPERSSCDDLVAYRCNHGSIQMPGGSETASCLPSGQWSAQPPVCMGPCDVPTIENGRIEFNSGGTVVSHDSTVTISCNVGYRLDGLGSRTCNNGTIERPLPRCIAYTAVMCPTPPAFANGRRTGGRSFGDTIVYICNTGYELSGASELICQVNGEWDVPYPTCKSPCDVPTIDNGRVEIDSGGPLVAHGQTVTISCNVGYRLDGPGSRMCYDGTIERPLPSCIAENIGLNRCERMVANSGEAVSSYGEMCYIYFENEKYWDNARQYCRGRGGEMVEIHNGQVMLHIKNRMKSLGWSNNGVWIGARRTETDYRWYWNTGAPVTYDNFVPGERDCSLCYDDCALMRRRDDWAWHDYPCHSLPYWYKFICQFSM